MGLISQQQVTLISSAGTMDAIVVPAEPDELPEGVGFLPYSQAAAKLIDVDTHGSGMPTRKGFLVTITAGERPEERSASA